MTFTAVMPRREAPAVLWVRRVCIAIVAAYALVFCWSIYRRIW